MAIVALDAEDRVLLVRQYRVAVGEALLEIPAGTLDVAEDGTVEDPDLAARRELEEETGMRAGTWRLLARFYTAPGFASELMHLYLATDLRAADGERLQPDEDEHLELERMPWREAAGRRRARRVPRREVARRLCSGWRGLRRRRLTRLRSIATRLGVTRGCRTAAARPRTRAGAQRVAVERVLRAQRDREAQVRAGLAPAAEPLQALAEREVREMRRRIDLEQRLEGRRGTLGLAGVEVRPPSASRIEPLRGSSRSARSRTIAAWA